MVFGGVPVLKKKLRGLTSLSGDRYSPRDWRYTSVVFTGRLRPSHIPVSVQLAMYTWQLRLVAVSQLNAVALGQVVPAGQSVILRSETPPGPVNELAVPANGSICGK
jgi:hypothetical protein